MGKRTATHRHHVIPKHVGGLDEPWNIAVLTIDEHAEAHLIRWVLYKQWQDRLAWLSLSKQLPYDQISSIAMKEGIKKAYPFGRPSPKGMLGKVPWNKGKKTGVGGPKGPRTKEWGENISKAKKGKSYAWMKYPKTKEHMAKVWATRRANKLKEST